MCKRVRFRTREKENVSITFRSNKLCIKRSKHYIYHVKLSIELRCVIYTLLCFYTYWNFCCHKILLLVCSVRSQIYYSNIIALYAPPIKMRSISSSERHDLYYCNRIKWRVVVKLLYAWWLCTLNILLLLFEKLWVQSAISINASCNANQYDDYIAWYQINSAFE